MTTAAVTATATAPVGASGADRSSYRTYESALSALMSPVHQATTPAAIRLTSKRRTRTPRDVRTYLRRIGLLPPPRRRPTRARRPSAASPSGGGGSEVSNDDPREPSPLPRNVVHIAGTKGKGSTSSMVESILRNAHGMNTGMFTSPHLVIVRERIRINGLPISEAEFGDAYWTVRERLERWEGRRWEEEGGEGAAIRGSEDDDDPPPAVPGYFRMLTLMAFLTFSYHTFPDGRKIDAMVLEVGMGGRYDATNVLDHCFDDERMNCVCGVTLIDLDHTRVLGTTPEQIAWEKGGIFLARKGGKEEDEEEDAGRDRVTPRPLSLGNDAEAAATGPLDRRRDGRSRARRQTATTTEDCPPRFFTTSSNPPGVLGILTMCAKNEGCDEPLVVVGGIDDADKEEEDGDDREGGGSGLRGCEIGLAGEHQRVNAGLAVALCQRLTLGGEDSGGAHWPR